MTGSPTNINVGRTMRNSYGRRIALKRPKQQELDAIAEELARLEQEPAARMPRRAQRIDDRCAKSWTGCERRRRLIAYVDPVDIRFNRFDPQPLPNASAVMFCLMDVSGSMGEREKDLAKRFFVLLHLFLKRRYDRIDIVFIRHTHEAQEVDEETFFYSTQSGGTVVSTALEEMRRIIEERYPSREWNIYAAQASDGDNIASDSEHCISLLNERLMRLCQYFAYVEIIDERESDIFGSDRQRHLALALLSHGRCELAEFPDDPHRQAHRDLSGLPQAFRQAAGLTEGQLTTAMRQRADRSRLLFVEFRLELRHAVARL